MNQQQWRDPAETARPQCQHESAGLSVSMSQQKEFRPAGKPEKHSQLSLSQGSKDWQGHETKEALQELVLPASLSHSRLSTIHTPSRHHESSKALALPPVLPQHVQNSKCVYLI